MAPDHSCSRKPLAWEANPPLGQLRVGNSLLITEVVAEPAHAEGICTGPDGSGKTEYYPGGLAARPATVGQDTYCLPHIVCRLYRQIASRVVSARWTVADERLAADKGKHAHSA